MLVGSSHLAMMSDGGGGGTPVIETSAISQGADAQVNHSITMPASIVVGDLILVVFAVDGAPSITVDTGVSGSNWTIEGSTAQASKVKGAVIWKIAEGSDVLELDTDASKRSISIAMRISGASDIDMTAANSGSNINPDPPNHTPTGGSDTYLWVAAAVAAKTTEVIIIPTNYSNLLASNLASGYPSIGTADRFLETASENPGTFTLGIAKDWVCFTIAVYP